MIYRNIPRDTFVLRRYTSSEMFVRTGDARTTPFFVAEIIFGSGGREFICSNADSVECLTEARGQVLPEYKHLIEVFLVTARLSNMEGLAALGLDGVEPLSTLPEREEYIQAFRMSCQIFGKRLKSEKEEGTWKVFLPPHPQRDIAIRMLEPWAEVILE